MKAHNYILPRFILICFLALSANAVFSQNASTYNGYLATRYFALELQLIKTTAGFTPPVASRALGYTGLALYEAVVPGIPTYQSADGQINGLGPNAITNPGAGSYHWPTVANNALGLVIDSLFGNANATNKALIRNLKDSFNLAFQSQVPAGTYSNSVSFGQVIGTDIFNFSKTDGGHQGYAKNFPASYTPPTGPGLWVPTPPAFQVIPLQPYWGNNRPFVADNSTGATIPGPYPTFSNISGSAFYDYALEVYNVGNNLTQEQKNIANYWADGGGTVTPPGHSISMLTQILWGQSANLETAVLAYGKLSMAMADAFINCWKVKYDYNLMRPVTYIRQNINPTWNAFIATPPFPEYTSGHSTQSGAFKEVMTGLFGSSFAFTDNTHGGSFGGPRSYANFEEPAQEAAVSRLYGGIHYSFSNELGVYLGNLVGQNINALYATQLRVNPMADVAVKAQFNASSVLKGQNITLTVTLLNQGLTALTGLKVLDTLPGELQFLSATPEVGTYNPTTGIWDIGSLGAGVSAVTLTIQAKVIGDGVPYNLAEVVALNEPDGDSAPNNQLLTEDDMASACISVPMVLCNPNLDLSAPPGYSNYQWFQSTDGGTTFQAFANTQTITVTTGGQYVFTVDNAVLGDCGNQLCCPVLVQEFCCPTKVCLPIRVVR